MNTWEIIDDNGTIYSGKEDYIRDTFEKIKQAEPGYKTKWKGDLKLVEIHATIR